MFAEQLKYFVFSELTFASALFRVRALIFTRMRAAFTNTKSYEHMLATVYTRLNCLDGSTTRNVYRGKPLPLPCLLPSTVSAFCHPSHFTFWDQRQNWDSIYSSVTTKTVSICIWGRTKLIYKEKLYNYLSERI